MRIPLRPASLLLLGLLACHGPTKPASSTNAVLVGSWATSEIVPGAWTTFTVQPGNGQVAGSGYQWGPGGYFVDSFTVSGAGIDGGGAVTLDFNFSKYPVGVFAGHLAGSDTLQGTLSTSFEGASPLTFYDARAGGLQMGGLVQTNGTVWHGAMGCLGYAILGDDGHDYEPDAGMPAAFQRDSLRVRLRAVIQTGVVSCAQVGPIVSILSLDSL